jgi:hypothetical protein
MPTPVSDPNEPSKMKKLISGNADDSIRSKLPQGNGSNVGRVPASNQPAFDSDASKPGPRTRRLQFLPAFWTIASLMSIAFNIVLIVILLIVLQMLGSIQGTANDKISGLLGGLYTNFLKMDQANIQTNIHVEKEIPVDFDLNVSGPTVVRLNQPSPIYGATVSVHTGGLTIVDANATIILPQGTPLSINIEGLTVPVHQKVMAVLDVPVNIPLNQTQLHEPFVGLQKVVEPWYCFVEPNATVNGMQVCSPFGASAPVQPAQTIIP